MFDPETDLWKLRMEIPLGSMFVRHYRNSFGFTDRSVCDFFDGFSEFVYEKAKEEKESGYPDWDDVLATYDNEESLLEWWHCFEEFPFELEEEEEEAM